MNEIQFLFPATRLLVAGAYLFGLLTVARADPAPEAGTKFDVGIDISGKNPSKEAKRIMRLGDAPGATQLSTGEREIKIYVHPDFESSQQKEAALRVALFAYEFFQHRGCGLGGRPLTEADANAFNQVYHSSAKTGLAQQAAVSTSPTGFFRFKNLEFNRKVEVQITNLREDEASLTSPAKKAKLESMRKAEEQRVGRLLLGDQANAEYPVLPYLVPDEIARRLKSEPRLRLDPSTNIYGGSNGVVVVPIQRAGRPLGFSFEGGASYANTENFTANGAIILKNALGREMFDTSEPYDTLEVDGRAGPQIQSFNGKWDIPVFAPTDQFQLQFNSTGGFVHNDKTAFPGPPPSTLETRVWSGAGTFSASYNSFSFSDFAAKQGNSESRRRFQYVASLKGGINYSDTTIIGDVLAPTLAQGRATTVNGRLGLGLIFDLYEPERAGIGEVELDTSLSGEAAPSDLSDQFNYSKWQAAVGATCWFGFLDERDFFFRQNLRMGSLYGTAPELSLFRLGGSESVRALQEGELAGRSVLSTSTELGFSLSRLGQLLFPERTNAAPADVNAPQGSPLAGVYLKAFFDWGRVSQNGSVTAPWHEGEGAVAYGVALDIAKQSILGQMGSFSLGYAFSPDSHLHRGGVIFAGASFPF